jgi:hypothetical protein
VYIEQDMKGISFHNRSYNFFLNNTYNTLLVLARTACFLFGSLLIVWGLALSLSQFRLMYYHRSITNRSINKTKPLLLEV